MKYYKFGVYSLFVFASGMLVGSLTRFYLTNNIVIENTKMSTSTKYTIDIAKACNLLYLNKN